MGRTAWAHAVIMAYSLILTSSCERESRRRIDGPPVRVRNDWGMACERASYHQKKLQEGEVGPYSHAGDYVRLDGPEHLRKLIEMRGAAVPVLLEMLQDETPTKLVYDGDTFRLGPYSLMGSDPNGAGRHYATIAELADYALRCICSQDVGYRGWKSRAARDEAVAMWHKVVQNVERRDVGKGD